MLNDLIEKTLSENLTIKTVSSVHDLEGILHLIAEYQSFYKCKPDSDNNRNFFGHLLENPNAGIQFAAYLGEITVGFATLYLQFSSTNANQYCLMNDLFVSGSCRGHGIGKKLIQHCAGYAREKGFHSLEWMTMQSNIDAQKLYDSFKLVEKTAWYSYSIPV